jgi:hypothetical protein
MISSSKNNDKTVLRFQLVLNAENLVISTAPQRKIRINITGLKVDQLENIIDGIADAGPEAVEEFNRLVNKKLFENY